MAKTYRVTVTGDVLGVQRVRAGVVVSKEEGYVGELTAEQLKAIKSDPCLHVSEVKDGEDVGEDKDMTSAQAEAVKVIKDAEAKAKAVVDAAKQEAAKVVDNAKAQAEKIVGDAKAQADKTVKEADELLAEAKKDAKEGDKSKEGGDQQAPNS